MATLQACDNLPESTAKFAPKFIPLEKIIELKERGLSNSQIGRLLGCTPEAIRLRLQNVNLDEYKDFKKNTDNHIEFLQYRLTKSISDQDIKKAGVYQRITNLCMLEDKKRLIRGQSTSNIAYQDVSKKLSELEDQEQKLLAELGNQPQDIVSDNPDKNVSDNKDSNIS